MSPNRFMSSGQLSAAIRESLDVVKRRAALLGVDISASNDEIRAAFRTRVKERGVGADITDLKDARDKSLLPDELDRDVNATPDKTCKLCGGTGRLGIGFGRTCNACQGTGQRTS